MHRLQAEACKCPSDHGSWIFLEAQSAPGIRVKSRDSGACADQHLQSIFQMALTPNGITKAKEMKSKFGVKDKFQEYYLEKIFDFQSKLRGRSDEKEKQLTVFAKTLPKKTNNPIWRLQSEFSF